MKTQIFFSILFILAVGCSDSASSGGGVPGTGLPELTPTQKQQITRFNTMVDDVNVLTDDPSQQSGSSFGGMFFNNQPVSKSGTTKATDALTKAQQELVEKMDWAKQNNHCVVSAPNSSYQPDNLVAQEVLMTISGSQCPLTYTSKMKSTPTSTNNGYNVTVNTTEKFVASPQGAVNLGLDIQSSDTVSKSFMSFTVSGAQPTGMSSQPQFHIAMNMSAKMTAESASMGTVVSSFVANVSGNVKLNPQTGESLSQNMAISFTATQTYQDFKVVAHMVASGSMGGTQSAVSKSPTKQPMPPVLQKPTVDAPNSGTLLPFPNAKFYINGKPVTEQEFAEVMGEFDLGSDAGLVSNQ